MNLISDFSDYKKENDAPIPFLTIKVKVEGETEETHWTLLDGA